MRCPKCGKEIPVNGKFCSFCGVVLPETPSSDTTKKAAQPQRPDIPAKLNGIHAGGRGNISITTKMISEDVGLVKPEGFLDRHTFEDLEAALKKLLITDHVCKIIVDLSKLNYISSAGAGVLIGAIGTARDFGGNIVFLSPTITVNEVLNLLGLGTIFQTVKTLDEAINFFSNE